MYSSVVPLICNTTEQLVAKYLNDKCAVIFDFKWDLAPVFYPLRRRFSNIKLTMQCLIAIHLLHLCDLFLLRDDTYIKLTRRSPIYVTGSNIPYFFNICEIILCTLEMLYNRLTFKSFSLI